MAESGLRIDNSPENRGLKSLYFGGTFMKKYSNDLPIIESLTGYGNEQSSGIFAFGLIGALLSVIAALVLWLNLGGLAVICDSQILMKVFHFHYTYGIIWLILTVVITVYLLK